MGINHRELHHFERANDVGSRATALRDRAHDSIRLGHPNGTRALHVVEHAIGHIQAAYAHQCMSPSDQNHFIGLADIDLDHAEKLLNE